MSEGDITSVMKEIEYSHMSAMNSLVRQLSSTHLDTIHKLLEETNDPFIQFKLRQILYQNDLNSLDKRVLKLYFGACSYPMNCFAQGRPSNNKVWKPQAQEYLAEMYKDKGTSYSLDDALCILNNRLAELIEQAPKLTCSITVYRGMCTDYLTTPRFFHKGFISTSIDESISDYFTIKNEKLVLKLKVPLGTPCLYWPREKEILLGSGWIGDICKNEVNGTTLYKGLKEVI